VYDDKARKTAEKSRDAVVGEEIVSRGLQAQLMNANAAKLLDPLGTTRFELATLVSCGGDGLIANLVLSCAADQASVDDPHMSTVQEATPVCSTSASSMCLAADSFPRA
jgi:hypothetical protein